MWRGVRDRCSDSVLATVVPAPPRAARASRARPLQTRAARTVDRAPKLTNHKHHATNTAIARSAIHTPHGCRVQKINDTKSQKPKRDAIANFVLPHVPITALGARSAIAAPKRRTEKRAELPSLQPELRQSGEPGTTTRTEAGGETLRWPLQQSAARDSPIVVPSESCHATRCKSLPDHTPTRRRSRCTQIAPPGSALSSNASSPSPEPRPRAPPHVCA